MKKLLVIPILLGSVFVSCVLDGKDDNSIENSHSGKRAYRYLENNIGICLSSYFDIALRMNVYLSASPEEWQSLEDRYFPEYKIRRLGETQWMGVLGTDTVFRLETDGRLLSEDGSCWIIGKSQLDRGIEKITCERKGRWRIEAMGLPLGQLEEWVISAVFEVEDHTGRVPEEFDGADWRVMAFGECLEENDRILLRFESQEPLLRSGGSDDLFVEGKLDIWAGDLNRQLEETVGVVIAPLAENGRTVSIVYRGKTYVYVNNEF